MAPIPTDEASAAPARLGGAIWLVDDNPTQAAYARRILAPPHDVEVFPDGAAMLERLVAGPAPEVLLLDWVMPALSGAEVCRAVRTRYHAAALPILVTTGHDDTGVAVEALDAGANDFVARTATPHELRARVAALLHTRRLYERAQAAEQTLTRERDQHRDESARYEILYRVAGLLTQDLDLGTVVQRLTDAATALCRAQLGACLYDVVDDAGASAMLFTVSGAPREAFANVPLPRSSAIFAQTFEGVRVVRLEDVTRDPRYGGSAPYHGMPSGHPPVRSYLAVPLVAHSGDVVGGLFLGHEGVGVFTDRDERLLTAIAPQAAVAIENARLYQTAQQAEAMQARRARQAALTADAGVAVTQSATVRGMLEACAAAVVRHLDAAFARIWTVDATGEVLELQASVENPRDPRHDRAPTARFEIGWIARTRRPYTTNDLPNDPRVRDPGQVRREGLTAFAGYPLLVGDRTVGVLAVFARQPLADDTLDAMAGVASVVALAIERKRAEQTAAAADARMRALFMQSSIPVAVYRGPDHVYELANPPYRALFGNREIVGKPVREALPELAGQGIFEQLDRVYATGKPFLASELPARIDRGDGTLSDGFFRLTIEATRDADGRIDGLIAIGVEVTDQVHARQRAEEANRAKDEFLSVASHELRTPLNAILGWTQLLRSDVLDADKRARALATIERNARSQAQLVDDILDVSRITAGKLRLELAPLEPAVVVEAALDIVRPAADGKGVQLQASLDPEAGTLMGDAARLQQVVWNLLSNAVKFTPRGGRVDVRVGREDSHVAIAVADTGQGIDPAFLPHIFEPFRQADASATRAYGGLGLGLAIVRQLVELHGGAIEVQSDGVGRGATFTVRIPIAPVRRASAPPASDLSAAAAGRPGGRLSCPPELEALHVLVVDDEPDARELVQSLLEQCRAEVATAGSVVEALERFRERVPDVLVSDIGMPGEDGYSLIRKVRALSREAGGHTPAVALTAYARTEDRTRALMEGFTNHVVKPVEPQELLAVIASLAKMWNGRG